jgi:hypothetical protein
MKTIFTICGTALFLCTLAFPSRANIIAGPIINPANGNEYYLLTPDTWSASKVEAEDMGGTLAVVKSGQEQNWIFSTFGHFGGADRSLWIGLHRIKAGGKFVWVDGSPLDYTHWYAGDQEPNDAGGNENCANMRGGPPEPGTWNDYSDNHLLNSVVEVQKKASPSLTQREQSLIGDWYESGRADRLCHIAGTENLLFAINESNNASGRAFLTRQGFLFVASWRVHGEIVKDKILWSNGTWWSRKPVEYRKDGKSSDKDGDTIAQ